MTTKTHYLGVGIYDVSDAAKLTGVSSRRIRRWLKGYQFKSTRGASASPPVWRPSLPLVGGKLALTFLDLMEVRFVEAFLRRGVSWKTIRLASQRAQKLFETSHPFSTRNFKTDGRSIFAQLCEEANEPDLVDVVTSQRAFERVLSPYLIGIEFDRSKRAIRWWPMGKAKGIVIDPRRSFGQPIDDQSGIPTQVLAAALKAEGSTERVSRWYNVRRQSIREAAEFERNLAA